LDIVEIGEKVATVGQVKQVKVLGTMALLDEGETDWKVITIDVNDPLASKLNDIEDVEKHLPGLLRATNEWFRIYKVGSGTENGWLGPLLSAARSLDPRRQARKRLCL
jgi:inorganic pyrophosphatase